IENQRRERLVVGLLEQRAAQHCLSGADVARDQHEAFTPLDRVLQEFQCVGVRLTPIEVLRVGSEAEGFLRKTVVLLVHQRAMRVGVSRMCATVSASRTVMIGTATPEGDVVTPFSCVTLGLSLK